MPGPFQRRKAARKAKREPGEGYHVDRDPNAPRLHAVEPRSVPSVQREPGALAKNARRRTVPPRPSPDAEHEEANWQDEYAIIPRTLSGSPAKRRSPNETALVAKCKQCGTVYTWPAERVNNGGAFRFRQGDERCKTCKRPADEVWAMPAETFQLKPPPPETREPFPTGAPPPAEPLAPMPEQEGERSAG